jgi:hypothetical protein
MKNKIFPSIIGVQGLCVFWLGQKLYDLAEKAQANAMNAYQHQLDEDYIQMMHNISLRNYEMATYHDGYSMWLFIIVITYFMYMALVPKHPLTQYLWWAIWLIPTIYWLSKII